MSTIAPLQRRRLACAIDLEESAVLLATAEYELDEGRALEHSPRRLDARVDLELLRAREALMREVIRGHQRSSEVLRGHQRSSEVIRGSQRSSEVLRGPQRSSEVIRGHQRSSEVITCVRVSDRVRFRSASPPSSSASSWAPPERRPLDARALSRARRLSSTACW